MQNRCQDAGAAPGRVDEAARRRSVKARRGQRCMLMASRSGRPCSAGVCPTEGPFTLAFPNYVRAGSVAFAAARRTRRETTSEPTRQRRKRATPTHPSLHTHSEEEELWLGVMLIRFLMIACFLLRLHLHFASSTGNSRVYVARRDVNPFQLLTWMEIYIRA